MQIDHVGIVVADLDETVRLYTRTLGFEQRYRETVIDQGVEVVGLAAGDSVVELLRPLQPDSPLLRFLGQAQTKIHHTAYRVPDLRAKLAELKARGVALIDETPRRGAHGNAIAFLHPKSTNGVLIELCQRISHE